MLFATVFIFLIKFTGFSKTFILGTISIFYFVEMFLVTVYYVYKKPQLSDEPLITLFHSTEFPDIIEEAVEPTTERLDVKKYCFHKRVNVEISILEKVRNVYLWRFPQVFNLLDNLLNLNTFDLQNSYVYSSSDPYNVEICPEKSLSFFMNLHEINDIRRINRYFILVNKSLKLGGVFVGKFQTLATRRKIIYSRYPRYLAYIVYFLDFIWKRFFPKMPFLQKFYFAISKGHDRVFSKAQGLGRLYYCGFKLIGFEIIDDFLYFVVKKTKEPSEDKTPSYGPLFKMKRFGKNKKIIYVYKFRTMHPYSEYLQDYVVNKSGYSEIGKPADDFRVTSWGRFLRRYWLDELPQLINVLKGEMKLVGIRPLSGRFLQEYPTDVLTMRFRYKPGCIPPYVAHKKQAVEEYIESERRYLLEKEKHPMTTDVKYFFWAIYNILTNKIRSS